MNENAERKIWIVTVFNEGIGESANYTFDDHDDLARFLKDMPYPLRATDMWEATIHNYADAMKLAADLASDAGVIGEADTWLEELDRAIARQESQP